MIISKRIDFSTLIKFKLKIKVIIWLFNLENYKEKVLWIEGDISDECRNHSQIYIDQLNSVGIWENLNNRERQPDSTPVPMVTLV